MTKPSGDFEGNKNALIVTPESPYPMIGGGAIRTASLFEFIAARWRTDVIVFRQPEEPDPRDRFPRGKAHSIHVVELPHHSRAMLPRAARNIGRAIRGTPPLIDRFAGFNSRIRAALTGKQYEIGVVEHFWCAPYCYQLRAHCKRLYLDLHNVESVWHSTAATTEGLARGLLHERFAASSENLERLLLSCFDLVLVTSREDAKKVNAVCPAAKWAIYPNALPWTPLPEKKERSVIVFSGNLEYQPNIAGLAFFNREIWPRVSESCPGLVWEIIGKNPQAVSGLVAGDKRIDLVGPVDDAIEKIASAKVAVVPLLSGSGTRVKILEAWAAATPVVSTPIGAEGLRCASGRDLILAECAQDFSQAIRMLAGDDAMRKKIGDSGRQTFEESYTWNVVWPELERTISTT